MSTTATSATSWTITTTSADVLSFVPGQPQKQEGVKQEAKYYTAYGKQYWGTHNPTCTCQVCGHCVINGVHDSITSHTPLLSDIPKLPPPDLKLYCPMVECAKNKWTKDGWKVAPRTFKRQAGLTQHLQRRHPGLLSGISTLPDCPPATAFGVTLEQGVYLETLWAEAHKRKTDAYSVSSTSTPTLGDRDIPARLASIYLGIELALDNPHLKPMVDNEINATMSHILNYFVMSTMGEARYLGEVAKPPAKLAAFAESLHKLAAKETTTQSDEETKQFTLWLAHHFLANKTVTRHTSRFQVWNMGLDIAAVVGYEKVLQALEFIFNMPGWGVSMSVGGRKWGAVARHGLKFVRNEESPLMALDSIVDVVHNGGWALNKYYHQSHDCPTHHTDLTHVLNLKQQSATSLLDRICLAPWLKGVLVHDLSLITRYLSAPDSEEKWRESENYARLEASLGNTIPRDTLADLECSPTWGVNAASDYAATNSVKYLQWLRLFGDSTIPATGHSWNLWVELITQTRGPGVDCPPPLAEFKRWWAAFSSWFEFRPDSEWYRNRNDAMVEFVSSYATLEAAEDAATARHQRHSDEVASLREAQDSGVSVYNVPTPEFVAPESKQQPQLKPKSPSQPQFVALLDDERND